MQILKFVRIPSQQPQTRFTGIDHPGELTPKKFTIHTYLLSSHKLLLHQYLLIFAFYLLQSIASPSFNSRFSMSLLVCNPVHCFPISSSLL